MPLVAVKNKYQVVIPAKVRREVPVRVGDFFEAGVERGKITFTPKSLLDREYAGGLEDVRMGRTYGPFNTATALVASLKQNIKRLRQEEKRR